MNPVFLNSCILSWGTLKTVLIGKVEDDEDPVCFFEVVFGQGEELLLASRVPNAEGDFVIVKMQDFFLQAEAQSRSVEVTEGGWE